MTPSADEFKLLLRRALLQTAIVLATLFVLILGTVFFFEHQIESFAASLYAKFGFLGLAVSLFITDCFITPIPPDLILLVVSRSALSEDWFAYVGILGVISTVAGFIGANLGRLISHFKWAQPLMQKLEAMNTHKLERFGLWGVVLGAVTPLPFSVTCWAAGFIRMKRRLIFLGCLLRIPRFWLYYWLIASSGSLSNYLRELF